MEFQLSFLSSDLLSIFGSKTWDTNFLKYHWSLVMNVLILSWKISISHLLFGSFFRHENFNRKFKEKGDRYQWVDEADLDDSYRIIFVGISPH